MGVGMNRRSEQAIVGFSFSMIALPAFDDADNSHIEQTTHVRRSIHQDQNVRGIAIVSQG
jgi:hypothetical protein